MSAELFSATGLIACATAVFLPLYIAELVIGLKYLNSPLNECHNASVVDPSVWLVVGSVTCIGCFVFFLCAVGYLVIKQSETPFVFVILYQILQLLFSLAWTIVGAVMLWRDNLDCKPQELHDMLYASVIIRLILVFVNCCTSHTQSSAR